MNETRPTQNDCGKLVESMDMTCASMLVTRMLELEPDLLEDFDTSYQTCPLCNEPHVDSAEIDHEDGDYRCHYCKGVYFESDCELDSIAEDVGRVVSPG